MVLNEDDITEISRLAEEEREKLSQNVNHPSHYGSGDYECIKVLKAWLTPEEFRGYLKGNALKYICREGKKDNRLQDVKKAEWYLSELVKVTPYEEKR